MVPVWLRRFLENTTLNRKLGLCEGLCTVNNPKSGSSLTRTVSSLDRFIIQVPYATAVIDWEVIFNHNEPDLPPDFIFDCHNFEPNFDNLEHLVNWDPRDPVAFSNVIEELYKEYKIYQASLLSHYPRIQTIYNYITQVIDEKFIEVHHTSPDKKNHGQDIISFFISITAPYEKIPKHMFNELEGSDMMLLKLTFPSPETSTRSTEQLHLSPRLQQVFGHGAAFPQLQGSSKVAQYITELQEFIEDRIEMLDNGVTKRKAYIEELVSQFEGGVIELDISEYHTASVLINYLDFNFILQVSMPRYFPKEQPKLTFRSIYHTDDSDKPFSKNSRSYPWSPRWSSQEMITRLQTYIQDVVTTFQKASVTQGTALKTSSSHTTERPPDYDDVNT